MTSTGLDDGAKIHRVALSDGCLMHVVESGSGPDLVALHGIPEDSTSFDRVSPALSAHARLIRPDLRGFGASAAFPGSSSVTMEQMARDLAEMVKSLGLERPILLGHDMGGYVAMEYAQKAMGPLGGLILLNTAYGKLIPRGSPQLVVFCIPVFGKYLLRLFGRRFVELAFELGFVDRGRADPAHTARCIEKATRQTTRQALESIYSSIGWARVMKPFRRPPPPRSLDIPSLIVWGERDWFLDSRLVAWLEVLLPSCTTVRLPGVGHFPHQEAPEETVAAISGFLDRLAG